MFYYCIVKCFNSQKKKNLRLTMSFGYFMYSHSLVPVIDLWFGSWQSWYQSNGFIDDLELSFCVFLHYCGNRLSNLCFVIITSSILRWIYFIVVFWFYLVVFSEWEGEHEMLLLLKQLIMLSSPFRMMLLLLHLNVEGEVAVVEECCFRLSLLMCDFRNGLVDLILWYFDC